jgi:hypothetical protein
MSLTMGSSPLLGKYSSMDHRRWYGVFGMVREEERGVDEKDWERSFFFFDFCRRRRHITVIGSDLKNKIENRMVHVTSKFLLNVIIFLGDQGPEEKIIRL